MAAAEEFIELYDREAGSVLVFFARRTLDAELAMDLTAETFAQAWRGWARVRPGAWRRRERGCSRSRGDS
jgi:DNA-directed RNA polymerase specialized sigma24 family protein